MDKIILTHPVVAPTGKEFEHNHAQALLSRQDNGGWKLKSGKVEGYPFTFPDSINQLDTDAANDSSDKGGAEGSKAESSNTKGGSSRTET